MITGTYPKHGPGCNERVPSLKPNLRQMWGSCGASFSLGLDHQRTRSRQPPSKHSLATTTSTVDL